MSLLLGIITLILAVGAVVAGIRRRRPVIAFPGAFLCAIGVSWIVLEGRTDGYRPAPVPDMHAESLPQEEAIGDYVSSDTCRSCHPSEYHTWHESYHRTMTQVASPESVLANFDDEDAVFERAGFKFELDRRGDEFWTRIFADFSKMQGVGHSFPETEGAPHDRRVVMTTGSHHFQIYWLDGPYAEFEKEDDRTVWMFPFFYDIAEKEWILASSYFVNEPVDFGDSPSFPKFAFWNSNCIKCHATRGVPRLSELYGTPKTGAVELGISCEACHGPGGEHVRANRDPVRRYAMHAKGGDPYDKTIVNPQKLDSYRSTQVCGSCHSVLVGEPEGPRFDDYGNVFQPGEDLHRTMMRSRVDDVRESNTWGEETEKELRDRFWSDGTIRTAGREYNGLLETACFLEGDISCLSCHQMHKAVDDPRSMEEWKDDMLGKGMRSNQACTQCHEDYREEPALTAHTHHSPESSGSSCYNCHMPFTTYGLQKGVRSHQIDSPKVSGDARIGRPVACNQCHLDKTLRWTANSLTDWYGIPAPELSKEEEGVSASVLWAHTGDGGHRALAAWTFGWEEAREISGEKWTLPHLVELLEDPYRAVRYLATKALRKHPEFKEIDEFPISQESGLRVLETLLEGGAVESSERLLLDGEGGIDGKRLNELLPLRDNRPIFLKE